MEFKMSERCETVVVEGQNGQPLIINKEDFDKEKHKLHKEKKETGKKKHSIVEKNGAYVIMDGEGKQMGKETYKTEESAQTMLDLLVGK